MAHGKRHRLTIVWIDEREQGVLCATGRSRRHAEQGVDLWRPVELTGLEVPVPEPHRRSGQGKTAAPVTGMERIFDALPLGNVGGDAAQSHRVYRYGRIAGI